MYATHIAGDPFRYMFCCDPRLLDLNLDNCPTEKPDWPVAFVIPFTENVMRQRIIDHFPDAREAIIPYSLNSEVNLVRVFRVDPEEVSGL